MQIKTAVRNHFTSTKIATIKKTVCAGENVEKLGPLYVARTDVKWYSLCGKQFCISSEGCNNHQMTSNSTLRYIAKRNENTMQETQVRSLGWEDPLEKEMATHSSILAWKIPRMEEHGRLQSMGWQRVGHDWATLPHFTSHWASQVAW